MQLGSPISQINTHLTVGDWNVNSSHIRDPIILDTVIELPFIQAPTVTEWVYYILCHSSI